MLVCSFLSNYHYYLYCLFVYLLIIFLHYKCKLHEDRHFNCFFSALSPVPRKVSHIGDAQRYLFNEGKKQEKKEVKREGREEGRRGERKEGRSEGRKERRRP